MGMNNMTLELIDKSEIKPTREVHKKVENTCVKLEIVPKEDIKPVREIPKRIESVNAKLTIVPREDIAYCERTKNGLPSNCACCEASRKEIFNRCKNQWNYNEF